MTATFLGKWRLYLPRPDVRYYASDGYASYEASEGPDPEMFCVWYLDYGEHPPGKQTNVAFIHRTDGQVCFLLNNGQYVGYVQPLFLQFVSTLKSAAGFAFPGFDPLNLPNPFTCHVQSLVDGGFVADVYGGLFSGANENAPQFTMSQVTPTWPSVQASGNGDGLDFAWVNLTGAILPEGSLVKTDFSHCGLASAQFVNVNFTGALLTNADLTGAILINCKLDGAFLNNCTLTFTDFSGCSLLGVTFEGATFDGTNLSKTRLAFSIFKQADLTRVTADPLPQFYSVPLAPPSSTNVRTSLVGCHLNQSLIASDWSMLDLTGATILGLSSPLSSATTPLQAKYSILTGLNHNNLSDLSLQNAVFDDAVLDSLNLDGSDLTNASFIHASMQGTILSNAILKSANMTGAQLGSLGRVFTLANSFEKDLNAGPNVDAALRDQFAQHGITLSATAVLNTQAAGRVWQLNDSGNKIIYTVRMETQADSSQVLAIYKPATAASLVNAYMPDAILTGANLYGITANNIQFYGSKAKIDGSAILEDAKLNGSNLSTVDFTQAQLMGANLSNSHLFNAKFNKANLTSSASGGATDLSNSNLQGADFTDAQLYGANLTNAAVAVNVPTKSYPNQGGVYLFSLPHKGDANSLQQYIAELNDAATVFSLNPGGDDATLQKYLTALKTNNIATFKVAFLKRQPPITLSNNAQIQTVRVNSVWEIVDGAASYTLWTDADEEGKIELYASPSLTKMRAAFKRSSMTLRWQASVSIDVAGEQWILDNDSDNPQNFSTGYVKFILKLNGNVLDLYGTALRILRLSDNNQKEFDTETCQVTLLSQTNMNADTVCPNGATLSVNQSRSGGNSWNEKWLRAATPPQPPACVPTDFNWCPKAGNRARKQETSAQEADNSTF